MSRIKYLQTPNLPKTPIGEEQRLSADVKTALLNIVNSIGAWTVGNAQELIEALETALNETTPDPSPLPTGFTSIPGVHGDGSAWAKTNIQVPLGYSVKVKAKAASASTGGAAAVVGSDRINPANQQPAYLAYCSLSTSANWIGSWYGSTDCFLQAQNLYSDEFEATTKISASGIEFALTNASGTFNQTASLGSQQNPSNALHLSLFYCGLDDGYKFTGDILGVEVLDGNGDSVEKLIPAQRDSDNVVGFYALTADTFYPSDTSTPFTAAS